jgi:hypothetical protein
MTFEACQADFRSDAKCVVASSASASSVNASFSIVMFRSGSAVVPRIIPTSIGNA